MGCVVQHACGHLVPSPVELTAVAGPHLMPSTQLPRVVLHTVAVEYEHHRTCVLLLLLLPPLLPSPHPELLRRREKVVEKLHEFEETAGPIVQLFEGPEVQECLENSSWPFYSWFPHKYKALFCQVNVCPSYT